MAAQVKRASLVVVTWNALEWSRRCIESITANTGVPYELIVVDNASSDGTRDFLREQAGSATVILNDANLGFGVAANQGAARARAPVIVFVNSDVLVTPGGLEPLCRRLEDDSHTAVAGARILDLHGRLDHAGALLGHDGWTMHYGAGDDPEKPEYKQPRRVDYVTGACLAVRARAFHETGGFDPWFETAYFEDVDLCLRLAARGWNVMYEPASTVLHAGGASGTAEGRARLVATNHPRFQQRWRHLLRSRPDAPLTARPERISAALRLAERLHDVFEEAR
jgi:GT2 family glycosyltransferase